MLDQALKTQLAQYLTKLTQPVDITLSLDDSPVARDMESLLTEIATLSPLLRLERAASPQAHTPSFAISRRGENMGIRFAGIPLGHEFTSLVLALLQAGGHPPKIEAAIAEQIRALDGEFVFETYISLSCQNCPEVVQALNLMAVLNPGIRHTMIDGALFREEVERRQIMAVPSVFLNGQPFAQGRSSVEEILARLDTGSSQRAAKEIAAKAVFDVLVIGGGPAGAAAAIYAARKGIRTGVVAERFGGQVLDTMAIENFISVKETEGPRLAAALEQHVRDYEVDIMNLQRARSIVAHPGEPIEIGLESGVSLKSKSVILATGARWREMNVPGEREYRGRGIAYCPHCDGPLFKGKRVAVIGGGNSGVEAAIDLAGIVAEVTLLEFGDTLRADAVLQKKLASLPNVRVITEARTTDVVGDGQKVTGLRYENRRDASMQEIALDGIFVQIGLIPNTDWLAGTIPLSVRGEIEIDSRGQTGIPGVFAAGDATTVPYKQIIIAMGEGAKAALGAFDHLIRQG